MTADGRLWVVSDDPSAFLSVSRIANPQDIQVKYNVRQYQTAGSSTSWTGGNGRPSPAQLSVPVFINGPDMGAVNAATDALQRLFSNAIRYYIGGRYVQVTSAGEVSPTRGRGGLTRDVTFVLNVRDPYWRLSDDDARPTAFPIDSDMALSLYPLGLFRIFSEAPGQYTLDPLTGTLTNPGTYSYTIAGQSFTLKTVEAYYDTNTSLYL